MKEKDQAQKRSSVSYQINLAKRGLDDLPSWLTKIPRGADEKGVTQKDQAKGSK